MNTSEEDFKILESLETSLWQKEYRFNKDYMNSITSDDFCEFGRSGKIYYKNEIINSEVQEINVKLPLKDFKINLIDKNTVLITYVSEVEYDTLEISNRSSIWIKSESGWKLRFHQGTPKNTWHITTN